MNYYIDVTGATNFTNCQLINEVDLQEGPQILETALLWCTYVYGLSIYMNIDVCAHFLSFLVILEIGHILHACYVEKFAKKMPFLLLCSCELYENMIFNLKQWKEGEVAKML